MSKKRHQMETVTVGYFEEEKTMAIKRSGPRCKQHGGKQFNEHNVNSYNLIVSHFAVILY